MQHMDSTNSMQVMHHYPANACWLPYYHLLALMPPVMALLAVVCINLLPRPVDMHENRRKIMTTP